MIDSVTTYDYKLLTNLEVCVLFQKVLMGPLGGS